MRSIVRREFREFKVCMVRINTYGMTYYKTYATPHLTANTALLFACHLSLKEEVTDAIWGVIHEDETGAIHPFIFVREGRSYAPETLARLLG